MSLVNKLDRLIIITRRKAYANFDEYLLKN